MDTQTIAAAAAVIPPTRINFAPRGFLNCEWDCENGATIWAHSYSLSGPWETVITLTNGQSIRPGPLADTCQLQAWVQWAASLPPTRHAVATAEAFAA